MTLNRKMVEIDNATSSSSALIIGEAAAIAEPPQIAVPKPTRIFSGRDNLKKFPTSSAVRNAIEMVTIVTGNDDAPVWLTCANDIVNPSAIME